MQSIKYWRQQWDSVSDTSNVIDMNEVLHDLDRSGHRAGGGWKLIDGKIIRTKCNTEKEFLDDKEEGRYLGKTYNSEDCYYSLLGQIISQNTVSAKITKCIDDAFIKYAQFYERYISIGSDFHEYTDFSAIVPFVGEWGTVSENQHWPSEMGKYAEMASIYFFVSRDNVKGRFYTFSTKPQISGRNGQAKTPRGCYLCIYYSSDYTSQEYVLVGLDFRTLGNVKLFSKKLNALFPSIPSLQ